MSTKKTGPAARKGSKGKGSGSTEKLRKAALAEIKDRIDGKPARAKKATKEAKPKRVSALDAAAQVLASSSAPMRAKELITEMASRGLWTSPGGKTPEATLYAAMTREIATKGDAARFRKADRGTFQAA
ncbi:MAG: winged helix-turn-helix domain-containing protein [Phycisphaerales bacterium]